MTRESKKVVLATWILGSMLVHAVAPQAPGEGAEEKARDEWAEGMMEEFTAVGRTIEELSEQSKPVVFDHGASGLDPMTGIEISKGKNPLLDPQCRKEALLAGVDTLKAVKGMDEEEAQQMARKHLHEHRERIEDGEVSYAQYLQHIGSCKAFCGPVVAHLIGCHVAAVASHEHVLVLFDFARADLSPEQRAVVADLAQKLARDPGKCVLLVGRASRIGDLKANRRLSGRRAFSVKDELLAHGVDKHRIETIWLGYEPPQIDARIASSYDLEGIFRRKGLNPVNQSVLMVLYEVPENKPTGHS